MNPNPGGFPFGQPAGSTFPFGQQTGSQQTGGLFNPLPQSTTTAIVNPLSTGGFSFSTPKTTVAVFASPNTISSSAGGGFSFTTPTTKPEPAAGFSIGMPPAYPQGGTNTGQQFGFGSTTTPSGFAVGQPKTATMAGSVSFAKPATPFGQPSTQTIPTAAVAAQPSGGFPFGQASTTSTVAGSFGFGQTSTSTTTGGFNVGTTNAPGSFGIGSTPASTGMGGFNFGGFGLSSASTTVPPTGFGSGTGSSATGGLNIPSTFSPATTGGFGMTSAAAPASTGVFGMAAASIPAPTGDFTMGATTNKAAIGGFTMATTPSTANTGGFGFSTGGTVLPGQDNMGTSAPVGFSMGSPSASTTPAFNLGCAPPLPPSGGYSIASTATPSLGSGLNLGSTTPSTGLSSVQPGGINFSGAASMPSSFGIQCTTSAGITPTSTAVFNVGATQGISAAGFTIGQSNAGFTLGQPGTTTTGFSIPGAVSGLPASTGATTAVSNTGFSLGQLTAPATSTTGLPIGQAVSITGGLVYPAPTSGTGLKLGSTATPAASSTTTSQNFGTGLSMSKPVGFSTGSISTAPTSSGFSFGQPSSSVPTLGQTTASTSSVGLGGISATTGLGGAQVPVSNAGQDSLKTDGNSIREAPLPTDIFATIATFETYKVAEKKASEENARQSATPFHKLGEDAKRLKQHIVKLSNQHAHLHSSAAKLKTLVVQDALNVEMGRRTQDTPMNIQGENKAPEEFFLKMVRSFEARMASCRNKIEEVEKGCTFKEGNSAATPEDIMVVLKREHRTVKMMAAQVYTLHNKLIEVYQKLNSNVQPKPALLFRTSSPEKVDFMSIANKDSSVLRPCLGDITSGLMEFQYGQQRAKAISLGAAPPVQALGQINSPFLAPQGQNSIFNSSILPSSTSFNMAPNTNNTSFNFGKRPFGSANTSLSTPFSLPTQTSGSLFGSNTNNSNFGMFVAK